MLWRSLHLSSCLDSIPMLVAFILRQAHIPAGPVYTPRRAIADEHVVRTGLLRVPAEVEDAIPVPILKNPVSLSRTDARMDTQAPRLGRDTADILLEHDYSADEIEALRDKGVV